MSSQQQDSTTPDNLSKSSEFLEKLKKLNSYNDEKLMHEVTSRLSQLQHFHDTSTHQSFTGEDLNQLEKVLDNIAENKVTMEDAYIIEALMIKHL